MILSDLHMHTTYCDGKNTPEEMVLAAMDKGLERIGFSEHSHIPFDSECGMTEEDTFRYFEEVSALKEKYRGRIEILCGIEKDIYSPQDASAFDYVIGSVHYVKKDGVFITVDDTPEVLKKGIDEHYNGDACSLAEDYYESLAHVLELTGADIIGHFDLVTKFVDTDIGLDTADPRYVAAWRRAADCLLQYGRPFEINTGAISRGWRSNPYPAVEIIEYLRRRGGRFILSSDSHSADNIAFGFDRFESLL